MKLTELSAEISGSVWKMEVSEGDQVAEDDVLMILESMKMEIPLMSTADGVVKEIKVQEGDSITEGTVVITIEE